MSLRGKTIEKQRQRENSEKQAHTMGHIIFEGANDRTDTNFSNLK